MLLDLKAQEIVNRGEGVRVGGRDGQAAVVGGLPQGRETLAEKRS